MNDSLEIAGALLRRPDFEGLRLRPYLCPAGYWTIGIGNRCLADGTAVTAHTAPITEGEAAALMITTVTALRVKLRGMVMVPLTPAQEGALLSWQYNVGSDAVRTSTLLRLLNQRFYPLAASQFARWNKATVAGKLVVLPGLTHRRAIERQVFAGQLDVLAASESETDKLNAAELTRVKG